jgi:pheromone shutdown protein TraB
MKNKDEMTEAIAELSKHFPAFKRHLLDERDLYLCHALVRTAQHSVSRAF